MQLVIEICSEVFHSLEIALFLARWSLPLFSFQKLIFLTSLFIYRATCVPHTLLQRIQQMFLLLTEKGRMLASFVPIGELRECLELVSARMSITLLALFEL